MSPRHIFFFFNDTATTEIYTLSLHDALPILTSETEDEGRLIELLLDNRRTGGEVAPLAAVEPILIAARTDRKSTRLNSSHSQNSYAVFCLKKKKITRVRHITSSRCALSPSQV